MEWETQHSKNVTSSQMTYRSNTKPIEPRIFLGGGVGRRVDLDKPTLKFIPKVKGTRAAATTWKKNRVRGGTQAALTSPQGSQ